MSEEHRAVDQDAALEAGLLAGTLPDEDRRDPFVADVGAALHWDNAVTPTRPSERAHEGNLPRGESD